MNDIVNINPTNFHKNHFDVQRKSVLHLLTDKSGDMINQTSFMTSESDDNDTNEDHYKACQNTSEFGLGYWMNQSANRHNEQDFNSTQTNKTYEAFKRRHNTDTKAFKNSLSKYQNKPKSELVPSKKCRKRTHDMSYDQTNRKYVQSSFLLFNDESIPKVKISKKEIKSYLKHLSSKNLSSTNRKENDSSSSSSSSYDSDGAFSSNGMSKEDKVRKVKVSSKIRSVKEELSSDNKCKIYRKSCTILSTKINPVVYHELFHNQNSDNDKGILLNKLSDEQNSCESANTEDVILSPESDPDFIIKCLQMPDDEYFGTKNDFYCDNIINDVTLSDDDFDLNNLSLPDIDYKDDLHGEIINDKRKSCYNIDISKKCISPIHKSQYDRFKNDRIDPMSIESTLVESAEDLHISIKSNACQCDSNYNEWYTSIEDKINSKSEVSIVDFVQFSALDIRKAEEKIFERYCLIRPNAMQFLAHEYSQKWEAKNFAQDQFYLIPLEFMHEIFHRALFCFGLEKKTLSESVVSGNIYSPSNISNYRKVRDEYAFSLKRVRHGLGIIDCWFRRMAEQHRQKSDNKVHDVIDEQIVRQWKHIMYYLCLQAKAVFLIKEFEFNNLSTRGPGIANHNCPMFPATMPVSLTTKTAGMLITANDCQHISLSSLSSIDCFIDDDEGQYFCCELTLNGPSAPLAAVARSDQTSVEIGMRNVPSSQTSVSNFSNVVNNSTRYLHSQQKISDYDISPPRSTQEYGKISSISTSSSSSGYSSIYSCGSCSSTCSTSSTASNYFNAYDMTSSSTPMFRVDEYLTNANQYVTFSPDSQKLHRYLTSLARIEPNANSSRPMIRFINYFHEAIKFLTPMETKDLTSYSVMNCFKRYCGL